MLLSVERNEEVISDKINITLQELQVYVAKSKDRVSVKTLARSQLQWNNTPEQLHFIYRVLFVEIQVKTRSPPFDIFPRFICS